MKLNTSLPRVVAISIATVFVFTATGFAVFLATCSDCEFRSGDWIRLFTMGNAIVLAVPGWVLSVVGIARAAIYMFVMAWHVNDSFKHASWFFRFNRFNLVFAPRYLNDKGLAAREKIFAGLLIFFVGVALWIPLILIHELNV